MTQERLRELILHIRSKECRPDDTQYKLEGSMMLDIHDALLSLHDGEVHEDEPADAPVSIEADLDVHHEAHDHSDLPPTEFI